MTDATPLRDVSRKRTAPPSTRAMLDLVQEALQEVAESRQIANLQRIPTRATHGNKVDTLIVTFTDDHSFFLDIEGEREW